MPASAPRVSIIIAAYNEQDTVGTAIRSAQEQTHPNVEIIVVNDGSADDTARVVREQFPTVTLIDQTNQGLTGARWSGVRASSGQYITFLDADDTIHPHKIAAQLAVIQEHGVDAVGTNGIIVNGRHTYYSRNPRGPLVKPLGMMEIMGYPAYRRPPGASVLISRTVYLAIGGHDPEQRAWDDADLFCSIIGNGYRLAYLNRPYYHLYTHPGAMSRRSFALRGRDNLRAIAKWDPRRSEGQPSPLTPRQYSIVFGDHATRAALACLREGKLELAREFLARLDEVPDPPPSTRLLRWLARRSLRAFGLAARVDALITRVLRGCEGWGIVGGVQQALRKRFVLGSLLPRSEERASHG